MVQVVVVDLLVDDLGQRLECARFEQVGFFFMFDFAGGCCFTQQNIVIPEEFGCLIAADFCDAPAQGVVLVFGDLAVVVDADQLVYEAEVPVPLGPL